MVIMVAPRDDLPAALIRVGLALAADPTAGPDPIICKIAEEMGIEAPKLRRYVAENLSVLQTAEGGRRGGSVKKER